MIEIKVQEKEHRHWQQIGPCTVYICVFLVDLGTDPELQFSNYNMAIVLVSTFLTGFLKVFNEIMHMKCLTQYSVYRRCSINSRFHLLTSSLRETLLRIIEYLVCGSHHEVNKNMKQSLFLRNSQSYLWIQIYK